VPVFFLPGGASLRDAILPGLFCGAVLARTEAPKPTGAARLVRVPAACAAFCVRIASRRDAPPGRIAHRPPLHSVRIASFDELARPLCSASTVHGEDAFRRNATGGCRRFFYRAMHPSGMPFCRGFFVGLSLRGTKRRSHPAPRVVSVFRRRQGEAFCVRIASRRDAPPGRIARRLPLHSVRIASFDDLALPLCSASTGHGGDTFRRNVTGVVPVFFLPGDASLRDATLPGLFCVVCHRQERSNPGPCTDAGDAQRTGWGNARFSHYPASRHGIMCC
jgi:hypothetical protein